MMKQADHKSTGMETIRSTIFSKLTREYNKRDITTEFFNSLIGDVSEEDALMALNHALEKQVIPFSTWNSGLDKTSISRILYPDFQAFLQTATTSDNKVCYLQIILRSCEFGFFLDKLEPVFALFSDKLINDAFSLDQFKNMCDAFYLIDKHKFSVETLCDNYRIVKKAQVYFGESFFAQSGVSMHTKILLWFDPKIQNYLLQYDEGGLLYSNRALLNRICRKNELLNKRYPSETQIDQFLTEINLFINQVQQGVIDEADLKWILKIDNFEYGHRGSLIDKERFTALLVTYDLFKRLHTLHIITLKDDLFLKSSGLLAKLTSQEMQNCLELMTDYNKYDINDTVVLEIVRQTWQRAPILELIAHMEQLKQLIITGCIRYEDITKNGTPPVTLSPPNTFLNHTSTVRLHAYGDENLTQLIYPLQPLLEVTTSFSLFSLQNIQSHPTKAWVMNVGKRENSTTLYLFFGNGEVIQFCMEFVFGSGCDQKYFDKVFKEAVVLIGNNHLNCYFHRHLGQLGRTLDTAWVDNRTLSFYRAGTDCCENNRLYQARSDTHNLIDTLPHHEKSLSYEEFLTIMDNCCELNEVPTLGGSYQKGRTPS